MALSIQIRGAGTAYASVAAAKTADNLAKAANPGSAGGWTVSATAAEFTDSLLTDLQSNRSSLGSLGVIVSDATDNKLTLNGEKVKAYKDVILKLSAANLVVTDNAAGLGGNNFSNLDAVYSKISAINVNDDLDISVDYSKYIGSTNEQALETLIIAGSDGEVAITNFSGTKASLDAAIADEEVNTIAIKDSIANLTLNASSITGSSKISSTGVIVSDTLANINTEAAKTLIGTTLTGKVSKVFITMSATEVTAANVTSTLAAIAALPTGIKDQTEIAITGSAGDIIKNAANITALGSRVTSIVGTGATVANLNSLSALKSKFTSIGITDTAGNLAKGTALAEAITSWTDVKVSGIKITAIPSSADLTKIVTAATAGDNNINVSISDTSANINKDLALTNSVIRSNSDNLETIEVKDGTVLKKAVLKMSNEQYGLLKDKLTGQNTFNLSAVAYGDLSAVTSNASVVNYSVKDAYSSITGANLAGLFSNAKLSSVDVLNATVANMTSINTVYDALSTSDKAKFKSVTVTDSSSSLLTIATGVTTKLKQLSANRLVTSINAQDAAIDKINTLKAVSKVVSIKVADTDINFKLVSNAKLIADKKVTGFSLTGVALANLTGANNAPNYLTNAKITSIGVSESAANVLNNRTIMNNSKISSITANGALVSNIAALSVVPEDVDPLTPPYLNPVSIHVTDTWGSIKDYFATGAGSEAENPKVKSFTITIV